MSFKFQFKSEDVISEGRITRENLEAVKQWVKCTDERSIPKDLPGEMIVLFLISCENNMDATKNTIMSYFKLKKNSPELHDNRIVNSKEMDLLMEVWTVANFPKRTKENYVIHYFKLEDGDYKKFNTAELLKASLLLIDVSLDKKNPPDGLIVICDTSMAGLRHLTKINFDICKKYFSFMQEALPIKLRSTHYMNSNFALKKFFGIVKSFIKNDVVDKMHFHSPGLDLKEFYKFVPKECLPKELGGDLPSIKDLQKSTMQQFIDKQEFYTLEEQLRKNCQ